ncbi:MAG TPA: N-acetyltransferase [Lactococcus sp.]|uniref:GNAT family N-acetyltransferase n=1 Tax=Lactococcus TaxID=1357 RepID=UPI000E816665|nr:MULTISPECIES: GNAT family N-acetyltransferase [Lactococcus]MBL3716840.1 GNAT family N-acetyltransferase [Lactococcus garvieae]HAP15580.1 N-acetyltransferase [Lactococcus sp.]HBC90858.1 N-acetyltransferase [Lactococcus sp.]
MKIRPIEPHDFAIVARLENQNWTLKSTPLIINSSAEKIMKKILKGTRYLLAEENGKILGVLDYGPRHKSEFGAHVLTFGIMTIQEARGKGIATQLIQYLIREARAENYEKITINAMSSNPEALHLYERLGFILEGQLRKEFYIDGTYVDSLIYAYYL